MKKYTIIPGEGLSEVHFGISRDTALGMMGAPDDKITDNDEGLSSEIWIYADPGISLIFEGEDDLSLVAAETNNPEAELFGKQVFHLSVEDIIELFKENGFVEVETEEENWGEFRLSFEDAMIDFYFENGSLNTVNWSLVTDDSEA
jgi:hypothetical protein